MNLDRIVWLAVLLGLVGPTRAGAASSANVKPSLMVEQTSIRPGESFWLGIRLQMAPGWHTYWKNPGDSGLPTRISWTLPAGISAGSIVWPLPSRMPSGPLMSYGYAGDVLLLVRMTPAATIPTGPTTLAARVDWLECEEACLPGRADLTLDLQVRPEPPAINTDAAVLFAATRRRLPVRPSDWHLTAHAAPSAIALLVTPPASLAEVASEAYFFAEDAEVVDYAARQPVIRTRSGIRLDLARAPNANQPAIALRGVLVLGTGSESRAIQIDLPVRSEPVPTQDYPAP